MNTLGHRVHPSGGNVDLNRSGDEQLLDFVKIALEKHAPGWDEIPPIDQLTEILRDALGSQSSPMLLSSFVGVFAFISVVYMRTIIRQGFCGALRKRSNKYIQSQALSITHAYYSHS
eukprot:gene5825-5743_t